MKNIESVADMKNLRWVALSFAIGITFFVFLLVFLAIFDANFFSVVWRSVVVDLQTFLGGLSVLAASLFAYHANTAMAEEVRRNNECLLESEKENSLVKLTLGVAMVRQQVHKCLNDLKANTKNYTEDCISNHGYKNLEINMPAPLIDAWNTPDFFPKDLSGTVATLTNLINIYISDYDANNKIIQENESFFSRLREKIQPNNPDQLLQLIKIETDEFFSLKHSWRRHGDLLKNIDLEALRLINALPLSRDWSVSYPPYPPEQSD